MFLVANDSHPSPVCVIANLLHLAGIPDCVGPGAVTLVVVLEGLAVEEGFEVDAGGFEVDEGGFEVDVGGLEVVEGGFELLDVVGALTQ